MSGQYNKQKQKQTQRRGALSTQTKKQQNALQTASDVDKLLGLADAPKKKKSPLATLQRRRDDAQRKFFEAVEPLIQRAQHGAGSSSALIELILTLLDLAVQYHLGNINNWQLVKQLAKCIIKARPLLIGLEVSVVTILMPYLLPARTARFIMRSFKMLGLFAFLSTGSRVIHEGSEYLSELSEIDVTEEIKNSLLNRLNLNSSSMKVVANSAL